MQEVTRQRRSYLCAHRRQVVTPRKIIDIRPQSSPVAWSLRAVIPFSHHLIEAARTVHNLLHLCFRLQIIRRWVKLAPQTVGGTVQIIHRVLEIVLCCLA